MRKINSFARRSSRLTNAQKHALDQLSSKYVLALPLDFNEEFWQHQSIILEIGFGNGVSLVEMCAQYPQNYYLGIEVYVAGIGSIINHAHQNKLSNLKVINADAIEVITTLPDNILSGLQLYFPDPWHKRKHNKRRIISREFINLLLPKLKCNASIHMATDWEEYAYQMLEVLSHNESLRNLHTDFATMRCRPYTKFERRAQKLGHTVWDLEFKVVK